MAKFRNINHSALEKAHFLRIERYASAVDRIYQEAVKEFARLAKTANFDPNKPFSFAAYPKTLKTANGLFAEMAGSVTATVLRGEKDEWLQAASNNDRLVDAIFSSSRVGRKKLEKYHDRNLEGLAAFQKRKVGGMGLSDRVWKQTEQFRSEVEMGIDLGLGEGKSAAALSRDLRSNLQDPEKLFRRVRDKHGVLHLSKNAQAYHPGQGVYRSSYKNAMRLTRTEINMAYRESDYHRWQEMDFVIGIEIRLSNNPNHCPMCAALAGKYPKDFKFTGWHPQCRCSAIPILKSDDDMADDIMSILNDEPVGLPDEADGAITAMPANYNKWMADNNQRILTAKSTPYFIRDNYVKGDVGKGLKFVVTEPVDPELSKPFRLTDKKIDELASKRGIRFYGNAQEFNSIIDGLDVEQFDTEFERVLSKHGIQPKRKVWQFGEADTGGKEVNLWYSGEDFDLRRTFKFIDGKKVVYHDYFTVDEKLQGKGFSKDVFQSLYKQYQNTGIQQIDVHANIDVGGYAWAKYGFSAKSNYKVSRIVEEAKYMVSASDYTDLKIWFDGIDKNKPVPMWELASKPYGKQVLLNTSWKGMIDLNDPVQRAVFEGYLFSRK